MKAPDLDPLLEELLDDSLTPYADMVPARTLEMMRVTMRRQLSEHAAFIALLEVVRASRLRSSQPWVAGFLGPSAVCSAAGGDCTRTPRTAGKSASPSDRS